MAASRMGPGVGMETVREVKLNCAFKVNFVGVASREMKVMHSIVFLGRTLETRTTIIQ